MKKQAICIQCHTKPEMVNFIIQSLPQEYFDFYVHIDKKSNIADKIVRQENVFFAERKDVRWGRFSQVEATLSMFRMVDCEKYSYIHLISGNCFFIKSLNDIIDFFKESDLEYIESNSLDENCTWSWHGQDRYACYYPQWLIQRPANKIFRVLRICWREFIMRTKIFKRRKTPVPQFFGGSSWFSITGNCLEWMMQYLHTKEGEQYIKFFRHGVCSDEVFFSTLVRYSPFAQKISGEHLRFMKWKGSTTGGPAILRQEDFNAMVSSKYIFARKFDCLETMQDLYLFMNKKERE